MRSDEAFTLLNEKRPAGDQPDAIRNLVEGLRAGSAHQTLLGVTGSGKTFTIANVIAAWGKPTLVIAHNKTLAAQLTQEYRECFPRNAVHYFVSYYDYYQPEAYVPGSDTYIAKEAMVNAEIDRLRHAATQSLLTRRDVIVVASVSAIYGLGNPEEYEKVHLKLEEGMALSREDIVRRAISVHFERTSGELSPGKLRVIADAVELMPTNEESVYRLSFDRDRLRLITRIDGLTRAVEEESVGTFFLFPAKHFVSDDARRRAAVGAIERELQEQLFGSGETGEGY